MALFGAAALNWTGDGDPEQLLGSRVSKSYFRVLGVTPLLGRALRDEDDRSGADPQPAYYRPSAQFPIGQMTLLALAAAARGAVWSLDPDLPVADTSTMAQHFDNAIAQPRFTMLLIGVFGTLGLGLAALGVYGVLSYYVAQRSHEIGVRVAIGARVQDVVGLVVGRGARLTLVGLVLGLAGAAAVSRPVSSVLFEVSPLDAVTFIGVAFGVSAVTLEASYFPARRAVRLDPITALRQA